MSVLSLLCASVSSVVKNTGQNSKNREARPASASLLFFARQSGEGKHAHEGEPS